MTIILYGILIYLMQAKFFYVSTNANCCVNYKIGARQNKRKHGGSSSGL
jgi:hypothetical protein